MNSLLLFAFHFAMAQSTFDGLQTGRYEIHKNEASSLKSEAKTHATKARRQLAGAPDVVKEEKKDLAAVTPPSAVVKKEPGIIEQVQSLAAGDANQVYEFYQENVQADDVRNNRVEIEIAPGVTTNDSASSYSYREYRSYFHLMSFKSNVWFTPAMGVSGRYAFSFGADTAGESATHSRESVNYEFIDIAVNFRRFIDMSPKSTSVEFNLLYSDNKMKVPSDSLARGRISSTGFGLGLKSRIPSSTSYAWVVGGNFFPKLQHSEGGTALQLSSGTGVDSSRVGLDLGGEFKLSRESQVIWNIAASSEKNLFRGTAASADPLTGAKPSNVSVTNNLLIFNLGYRWGQ